MKYYLLAIICFFTFKVNAFETSAKYAILLDYDSKRILFEKNSHEAMPPSSMSKMLTAYIAFEALRNGEVNLTDQFQISQKAWKMGGTRMFIPLKGQVSFQELLRGLIIQSGGILEFIKVSWSPCT